MEKAKKNITLNKSKKENKISKLSLALKNNLLRRKLKNSSRTQSTQKELT
ncbi:MAG: hypothetical protein J0M23_01440 [Rickettsiales bacterium]|nr:hypothetical protein [Rickettsiales bacterium]